MEEAVAAAEQLNREGVEVTLDSLGESVTDEAHAEASAAIYHQLLDEIAARGLRANISLKLTQMGMDVGREAGAPDDGAALAGRVGDELAEPVGDELAQPIGGDVAQRVGGELAERIVGELVEHAAAEKNFVRIDMEGAEYTEATVAMTERLHARFPGAVGTVLQAYLYRTAEDAERLLRQRIRIRLCKGAYKEPPEIAFPAKADVDANYARLMERLVTSGVFCGIATHDEALVERLCRFVETNGVAKTAFEFQMLYGIRRDLQRRLVAKGYGVRVYVPFGTEWYPYFMRRLAERPANVLFLARNLLRS